MTDLSGWLGRRRRGSPWHRMLQGGSRTLCGVAGAFSAGPTIDDTFRHPNQVATEDRCAKCERLFSPDPTSVRCDLCGGSWTFDTKPLATRWMREHERYTGERPHRVTSTALTQKGKSE